ncbi:MAG: hypothetical protein LBC88_01375 [Spirochaetaceae bacterium]|jgi:phosphoglycerate dehydrogenase-like enzyme|nr:hypothetical protein [Spirochaetaceae bacterium]
MNILVIGNRDRYEKFSPEALSNPAYEITFFPRGTAEDALISRAGGAEIILADAIAAVPGTLIERMPRLRLIHSEGVAYDKIDMRAADEKGILVCNNRGCNAAAVAEQTILLMLAWLRSAVAGDREVRAGNQIAMKERKMVEGITELGSCTIGLAGFGDIAKATAERLNSFGCRLYYYAPHRRSVDEERAYRVRYAPLYELAALSDIVSVHAAVTDTSRGMINAAFIARMKQTAFIVNTARGEIIDNAALRDALIAGKIAGAAFDCLYPEPTPGDHPLVDLPASVRDRVVYAPHLGGITTESFRRAHKNMWANVDRIAHGKDPVNIVNRDARPRR